jgi:hypothetical protein
MNRNRKMAQPPAMSADQYIVQAHLCRASKSEASLSKLCRAPYAVENEARKGGREEVGAEKKEGVDTNVIAALVGEEDLSDGDLDQSLDSASEDALDASGQDPDGAGGDFPA